jgi:hypothetical protein
MALGFPDTELWGHGILSQAGEQRQKSPGTVRDAALAKGEPSRYKSGVAVNE